jgi:hypothetical protein
MKYTVKMGSGAMIYVPSFIRDLFRHSEVNRGDAQTQIWHGDSISLLSFFKIRKLG